MSGRARFRKTGRRASPEARARRFRPKRDCVGRSHAWTPTRLVVILPIELGFAISNGEHDTFRVGTNTYGVTVDHVGRETRVVVMGRDARHSLELAGRFLAPITAQCIPMTFPGVLTNESRPTWKDACQIHAADGRITIERRPGEKPLVFEGRK